MAYKIFQTADHTLLEDLATPGELRMTEDDFCYDALFSSADPIQYLRDAYESAKSWEGSLEEQALSAPIANQEVWAAGVTYFRSRTARMEEAEVAGGDVFYDKVYEADRPELFFKAPAYRVRGHGSLVGVRRDSTWDVPEPEFTLAISNTGRIFGFTIGNDMSSRSIEGENPLYLPQAKCYNGSCSLGPCLVVADLPPQETEISIAISRMEKVVFSDATTLAQIKRSFTELSDWLFRCTDFPKGVYLMTGTGIVPGADFTLQEDDEISITIDGVGTLSNRVEKV